MCKSTQRRQKERRPFTANVGVNCQLSLRHCEQLFLTASCFLFSFLSDLSPSSPNKRLSARSFLFAVRVPGIPVLWFREGRNERKESMWRPSFCLRPTRLAPAAITLLRSLGLVLVFAERHLSLVLKGFSFSRRTVLKIKREGLKRL